MQRKMQLAWVLTLDEFQSSTRFLEFATVYNGDGTATARKSFNPLRGSSSLQHCGFKFEILSGVVFQSSTRFLEFATLDGALIVGRKEVSILYEVPRVCNIITRGATRENLEVSILYEVPRVCNRALGAG